MYRSNLAKEKQSIIIKTKDHVLDSVKRQEIFVGWSGPEGPQFAGSVKLRKFETPYTIDLLCKQWSPLLA